jgi:hypothetical protein
MKQSQRYWKKMMSLVITILQIGEALVEIGAGNIAYKQEIENRKKN